MRSVFKFPFAEDAEKRVAFVRKSISYAYVLNPEAINYSNALYEMIQVVGVIPVEQMASMGFSEDDVKHWNDKVLAHSEEYGGQEFEITFSPTREYYNFPLVNLYFDSYLLGMLEEGDFADLENMHTRALVKEAYRKKASGCLIAVTDIIHSPFIHKTDSDKMVGSALTDIMVLAAQQMTGILAVIVPEEDALLKSRLEMEGYEALASDRQVLLREPFGMIADE